MTKCRRGKTLFNLFDNSTNAFKRKYLQIKRNDFGTKMACRRCYNLVEKVYRVRRNAIVNNSRGKFRSDNDETRYSYLKRAHKSIINILQMYPNIVLPDRIRRWNVEPVVFLDRNTVPTWLAKFLRGTITKFSSTKENNGGRQMSLKNSHKIIAHSRKNLSLRSGVKTKQDDRRRFPILCKKVRGEVLPAKKKRIYCNKNGIIPIESVELPRILPTNKNEQKALLMSSLGLMPVSSLKGGNNGNRENSDGDVLVIRDYTLKFGGKVPHLWYCKVANLELQDCVAEEPVGKQEVNHLSDLPDLDVANVPKSTESMPDLKKLRTLSSLSDEICNVPTMKITEIPSSTPAVPMTFPNLTYNNRSYSQKSNSVNNAALIFDFQDGVTSAVCSTAAQASQEGKPKHQAVFKSAMGADATSNQIKEAKRASAKSLHLTKPHAENLSEPVVTRTNKDLVAIHVNRSSDIPSLDMDNLSKSKKSMSNLKEVKSLSLLNNETCGEAPMKVTDINCSAPVAPITFPNFSVSNRNFSQKLPSTNNTTLINDFEDDITSALRSTTAQASQDGRTEYQTVLRSTISSNISSNQIKGAKSATSLKSLHPIKPPTVDLSELILTPANEEHEAIPNHSNHITALEVDKVSKSKRSISDFKEMKTRSLFSNEICSELPMKVIDIICSAPAVPMSFPNSSCSSRNSSQKLPSVNNAALIYNFQDDITSALRSTAAQASQAGKTEHQVAFRSSVGSDITSNQIPDGRSATSAKLLQSIKSRVANRPDLVFGHANQSPTLHSFPLDNSTSSVPTGLNFIIPQKQQPNSKYFVNLDQPKAQTALLPDQLTIKIRKSPRYSGIS